MKLNRLFCLVAIVSLACQDQKNSFIADDNVSDGWTISSPDEAGFDEIKLQTLLEEIPSDNPKLDAIVVSRKGKIIIDKYFNGYTPDKIHKIWSITKTITGIAVGIAADAALLSEHDSLHRYLGTYLAGKDSALRAITIEHILTMTSGLEWVEMGGPASSGFKLPYSDDWIEFVLNQPISAMPGEVSNYSSGNTLLLAPVVKMATGVQVEEYASEMLFKPLDIRHYEWDKQSEFWTKTQSRELPGGRIPSPIKYGKEFSKLTNTASGLRMRPRDLCKIGQLCLNEGMWNGKQIVSREWLKKSTQAHFGNRLYGYNWRLMNFKGKACYYATGFGMQRLFVFPEYEMVVVLVQDHYRTMPKGRVLTARLLDSMFKAMVN